MRGLYFLLPMLLTILISFLFVRAAAIALMLTGLDRHRAIFQALSAFTGTGFTTREAERVTNHPVRRNIISWLMILGNAGLVAVIITATSTLTTSKIQNLPLLVVGVIVGLAVIYKLATSRGFIRSWERIVEERLVKHPAFEEEGAEDLLHFMEGYGLVRLTVTADSPLAGKAIADLRKAVDKITILGIERGKSWVPTPGGDEAFADGDRIVVYGKLETLNSLSF